MQLPPKPTYAELEAELHALRLERATRLADAERLTAWMDDPTRKPAVLAFTEGNERQLAYRIEMLLPRATASPKDPSEPDLWVSEQHGTLVAIPGYLEPDTSVYKTWLKANYCPDQSPAIICNHLKKRTPHERLLQQPAAGQR